MCTADVKEVIEYSAMVLRSCVVGLFLPFKVTRWVWPRESNESMKGRLADMGSLL